MISVCTTCDFDRYDILAMAREYLGTPYEHQGRLAGAGVDCLGLVVCVFNRLGYARYDRRDYGREAEREGEAMLRVLRAYFDPIDPRYIQPGDVLAFRMSLAGPPQHVGIVTHHPCWERPDQMGLIHSYIGSGRVVEHDLEGGWVRRITAAFSCRGIAPWGNGGRGPGGGQPGPGGELSRLDGRPAGPKAVFPSPRAA